MASDSEIAPAVRGPNNTTKPEPDRREIKKMNKKKITHVFTRIITQQTTPRCVGRRICLLSCRLLAIIFVCLAISSAGPPRSAVAKTNHNIGVVIILASFSPCLSSRLLRTFVFILAPTRQRDLNYGVSSAVPCLVEGMRAGVGS